MKSTNYLKKKGVFVITGPGNKSMYIDDLWKRHLKGEISVDEYFEFSMLDEGEILEVDCIPMYNDLIDYFEDKDRKIRQIFICLTDKIKNEKLQFTQTLWNDF